MDLEKGYRYPRRRGSFFDFVPDALATAGVLAGAGSTAGSYWYNKLNEQKRGRSSLPPSPPPSPRMRSRSVSRGRRRTRSPRVRARSYSRSSSRPVTRQNDQSVTYSGRRRRRRAGRGGRRFRYRVMQTVNSMQPLQVWTSDNAVNGTSNVDTQGFFGIGLYQTTATGSTDLSSIFTAAGLPLATTTNRSGKLVIKSACLDLEVKNNGTETVILDCYELLCMRDPETTNDLYTQFVDNYANLTTITSKSVFNPAVSVFENPEFCKYYKVLNKREILLPADETMTMQMRNGKDKLIIGDDVVRQQFCMPKLSRFYFFMWHGPPDPTVATGSNPGLTATSLTFAWQKAYKYAIVPGKQTGGATNT